MIRDRENSYVEFKEDPVDNGKLAREIVDPAYYEVTVKGVEIGVVEVEYGSNKPYYLTDKALTSKNFFKRYGSTTREIKERDELQRLFQASQNIHYEIVPAAYADITQLDVEAVKVFLEEHKSVILKKETNINRILENLELAINVKGTTKPTIAGIVLFGKNRVKRFVPQSGMMCVRVAGVHIRGDKKDVKFLERNAFANFEDAVRFFSIHNRHSFVVEGVKRRDLYEYPVKAFRELLANAIIHRDYTIAGSENAIWIYDDRVELRSPGAIPNTLTIEKMRFGAKYHRNPVLSQFLSYAGIVEMMGQGIPKADEHEVVTTMHKHHGALPTPAEGL